MSLKRRNNVWWSEHLIESVYGFELNELSIKDLLTDIVSDDFCNVADYETKKAIYLGSPNQEAKQDQYNNTRKIVNHTGFIEDIIIPMLNAVNSGLDFFRKKNYAHISFNPINTRLLMKNNSTDYLFSLVLMQHNNITFNKFVMNSLNIFGIDGIITFKKYNNSAIEVDLISGLKETIEGNDPFDENKVLKNFYLDSVFIKDYSYDSKTNIADLGKGTSNLIGLILKIYSLLDDYHHQKRKSVWLKEGKRVELEKPQQKLILIEEPEAFLHPDWQSKLADFFLYCINYSKDLDVKFIIESHSEYLIRKLQFLTAKNKIDPGNSVIYYFNLPEKTDQDGEQIKVIQIQNDGMLNANFGVGFFDQADNIAIELYRLQRKNHQAN